MSLESSSSLESAEVPLRTMVAGIIIRDKKLLVVHNIKRGLRIEPPGGKVNDGEDLEAALHRELEEELGIRIGVTGLFGLYETRSPEGGFAVSTFRCEILDGQPQEGREPEKIGKVEWLTLEQLEKLAEESRQTNTHLLVPNLQAALKDLAPLLR